MARVSICHVPKRFGATDVLHGVSVAIGERVANNLAPKERDTAMVFQNYALYPHVTVRDNLAFRERVAARPGETIQIVVDPASVHLFDGSNHQRMEGG